MLDKDSCRRGNVVGIFRRVNKKAIDIVQLRENTACDRDFLRDARIIKQLCRKQVIFLVNNRPDIARIAGADGLHLGQTDLPLSAARRILGKNRIIGASCHTLVQALRAESEGADYISIGPVFRTQVKPDLKPIDSRLIRMIKRKIKIPFFVIGGINRTNVNEAISYGAKRVALCRAICCAAHAGKAALELKNLINDCNG